MDKKIIAVICASLIVISVAFASCGKKKPTINAKDATYEVVTDEEGNTVLNENGEIEIYVTDEDGKKVTDENGEIKTGAVPFPNQITDGVFHETKYFKMVYPNGWTVGNSGIATSKKYKGLDEIWVVARRRERLRELKKEIIGTRVRILPLDLMEEESFERLKMVLAKEQPVVRILVNASGYGISGSFEHQTEEDAAGMIHLNCEALTRITYLVLPYLRRGSFIYQMASSAGFAPQPNFTVYAATKAYVKSFSIALRQELSYQGIRVIAVCPGPVKTEFFDRADEQEEMKFYKKFVMADPKKVVRKAIRDARKNKAVSVYGMTMKVTRVICKLLPGRWIAKIMGK